MIDKKEKNNTLELWERNESMEKFSPPPDKVCTVCSKVRLPIYFVAVFSATSCFPSRYSMMSTCIARLRHSKNKSFNIKFNS